MFETEQLLTRIRSAIITVMAVGFLFLTACDLSANASTFVSTEATAKNLLALENAKSNIEKYRKRDFVLSIVDKNSKPIAGANVKIKQITHEFKFGSYLKIDDLEPSKLSKYEEQFTHLFNYAVIGTYWDFIETKQNEENWNWFEKETEFARKNKLRIAYAPILWGTNSSGTPKWLPKKTEKLSELVNKQIKTSIDRTDADTDVELVNEPLSSNPDFFARNLGKDYVENAFREARSIAPNRRLMINEYGVVGDENAHNFNRDKYFDLLNELIRKGTPIDIIGIQAHANGEWYQPANVAEQLDRYASLGKPIQISEFSSQTFDFDDRKTPLSISGKYRRGSWDFDKQGEFYKEFYTIAFGNPAVEAIVTWGIDDERGWLPGIGVIDIYDKPKPVYKTLDNLINTDWNTSLEGTTNTSGQYSGRGFYGEYEIEITTKSKKQTKVISITKNSPSRFEIEL